MLHVQRFTHSLTHANTNSVVSTVSYRIDQEKPCCLEIPPVLLTMISRKSPLHAGANILIEETASKFWHVSVVIQASSGEKEIIARASFSQGPWGPMVEGHSPNLDHIDVVKAHRRKRSDQ